MGQIHYAERGYLALPTPPHLVTWFLALNVPRHWDKDLYLFSEETLTTADVIFECQQVPSMRRELRAGWWCSKCVARPWLSCWRGFCWSKFKRINFKDEENLIFFLFMQVLLASRRQKQGGRVAFTRGSQFYPHAARGRSLAREKTAFQCNRKKLQVPKRTFLGGGGEHLVNVWPICDTRRNLQCTGHRWLLGYIIKNKKVIVIYIKADFFQTIVDIFCLHSISLLFASLDS